jgi:hypothetical protein
MTKGERELEALRSALHMTQADLERSIGNMRVRGYTDARGRRYRRDLRAIRLALREAIANREARR